MSNLEEKLKIKIGMGRGLPRIFLILVLLNSIIGLRISYLGSSFGYEFEGLAEEGILFFLIPPTFILGLALIFKKRYLTSAILGLITLLFIGWPLLITGSYNTFGRDNFFIELATIIDGPYLFLLPLAVFLYFFFRKLRSE